MFPGHGLFLDDPERLHQLQGAASKMAFTFAAFVYIVALILTAVLIFFAIFTIIAIDELKTDYKNPIEQCNSLNPLVLPEYGLHLFFCVLFAAAFEWGSLALNVPLIAYNIHRYMNRPVMSGVGIYDPTTIMNTAVLNRVMKEGWIKLGFFLVTFFYYLYCYRFRRINKDRFRRINKDLDAISKT